MSQQRTMTLKEMLNDLPTACDKGGKRDSKGNTMYWHGYKLHVDTIDGGIPVSAIITSASVHDSQVAIPLLWELQWIPLLKRRKFQGIIYVKLQG